MILADILSSGFLVANDAAGHAASDAIAVGDGAIEYSISLGNLLTIAGFIVFITIYIVNSRGAAKVLATELKSMNTRMNNFSDDLKKLGDVLIGQERQDGRIDLVNERVTVIDGRLMQEGKRLDAVSESLGGLKNMIIQDLLKERVGLTAP